MYGDTVYDLYPITTHGPFLADDGACWQAGNAFLKKEL